LSLRASLIVGVGVIELNCFFLALLLLFLRLLKFETLRDTDGLLAAEFLELCDVYLSMGSMEGELRSPSS
jgi:hypothetical protein